MLEINFENGVFNLTLKHLIIRIKLHKKNRILFKNHFGEDFSPESLVGVFWDHGSDYMQTAVIVLSSKRNSSVS